MPAGQVIYDSLKSSFVDFARLITTLEKEAYTGYVRLLTDDAVGLILFRAGSVLECLYDASDDPTGLILGKSALQAFNDDVAAGHGVLDVIALSAELINGLYNLAVSKPLYAELYASWVEMRALLKFLADRKLSGSVMIRAAAGTGVIILAGGELAGAYTSVSRDIADQPDRALALCEDPNAMIEVKSAATTKHQPLDVDEVLAAQRTDRSTHPPQAVPTPPPPPPAPLAEAVATSWPALCVMPPTAPAVGPVTASYASIPRDTVPLPTPPTQPPVAVAPTTPPVPAGPQLNWAAIVAELQAMAEDSLGHRARKVKEVLGGADPSRAGIQVAIDQVASISILFVDSSRLEQLAQEMRARLNPR